MLIALVAILHVVVVNHGMAVGGIPLVAYLERRGEEAYFCQISDSTTSYGSYSGATPNEKITWDKLTEETPMFVIESDATIVVPLMLTALLECARDPNGAARVIVENA